MLANASPRQDSTARTPGACMAVFTDKLLTNIKPSQKRYILWEDNRRRLGTLGVRVTPSGRRTWIFMYRFNGRSRMATLGCYPKMSVAMAHAAAGALMEALDRGYDPSADQIQARRELQQTPTVKQLSEKYIEQYAKRRKRSWKNDQAMLARSVIPRIGHLKVTDVRRRDIISMIEQIAVKAPIMANRVLEVTRKMYNWAVEREIVETSPCWRVSRPSPENQRDRVLSPSEIRQLWTTLNLGHEDIAKLTGDAPGIWVSKPVRNAFKLLLVTVQRRAEVAYAAKSEFDLEERVWTIPATRSKNGKSHRVPLSGLAIEIIEELIQLAGDSPWLIPSPYGNGEEPIDADALSRAVARLRKHMNTEHFHVHDLRRTAASHMASLGVQRTIIKKILNHTDRDITAVYDRYGYDAEKRAALEAWAKHLQEMTHQKDTDQHKGLRAAA